MNRRRHSCGNTLAVALVFAAADVVRAQTVVFVDANAVGAETGTSWDDAWTDLQDALDRTVPGDRIWVATGRYRPGTLRNATFQILDGVEVYGGFAGVEDPLTFDLADRDLGVNETILDGEIAGTGGTAGVFHVVTGSGTSSSAILDGFTITGGHADGATVMGQDVGGGMLIVDGSPTIRNCTFRSNEAGTRGGAVHNYGGSPTFIGCRFFANRTTVTQTANNLGGAFYSGGEPWLTAGPTLINCLFVGNWAGVGAGGYGGGLYDDLHSSATLVNCTLSQNQADTDGGGIFGSPRVASSILWANHDRRGTGRSSQIFGSAIVEYSCVQGDWADTGNTGDDPLFANPAGGDGLPGTDDDDLRLSPGSPCIDAGDNETEISRVTVDLAGDPRFVDDPVTPDRGNPPSADAIVDMGAYEYQAACDSAADCNDRIVCNGAEICSGGECQPGTPPDCDDNVACTVDACDMVTDECRHTPDDTPCGNGSFCDGVETCNPVFGCQDGAPIDCDDGVDCTLDTCDDSTGGCASAPDHDTCNDGAFCNGVETCDIALGCVAGSEPCAAPLICDEDSGSCVGCAVDDDCEDELFCNGVETCAGGSCQPGDDPCPGQSCDEDADTCLSSPDPCTGDEDCDDQNPCTDDACDAGDCNHEANVATCDDGDPCTTDDVCSGGACGGTPISGCEDPPPPPPPDGDGDGVIDEHDLCGGTPVGEAVDATGCSCSQRDGDDDGVNDCDDECPTDAGKDVPGACGCDHPDTDSDEDQTPDCIDDCPDDPEKIAPGVCGCSVPDDDGDDDGTPDCHDLCAEDPGKTEPGECGCGVPDDDTDADGVLDCDDACPDTEEGAAVGEDGCAEEPPAGQPVPDPVDDLDGTAASADEDPNEPDLPAGLATGRPLCGACGAFGLVSGALLWVGLLGLRTSTHRRRNQRDVDTANR